MLSVTTKGRSTIPAELREKLGIKPGDRIVFVEEDGGIVIRLQQASIESMFGMFKAKRGVSLADMAVARAAGHRLDRRPRSRRIA